MQFTKRHMKQILLLLLLNLPKRLVGGDYLDTFFASHISTPLQTPQILQCKVSVTHQQANMAEILFSHGCSGNDCMTCRNRFSACEWQEWTWLSELPGFAWAGLCLRPFYLWFFPRWQWRKQSEKNTAATGWNLAHLIYAGPSLGFWTRAVWAESEIWNSWVPEARRVFPYLKGQYKSLYIWKLRPELGWHEEGSFSPGNAVLRHDVCRSQREILHFTEAGQVIYTKATSRIYRVLGFTFIFSWILRQRSLIQIQILQL